MKLAIVGVDLGENHCLCKVALILGQFKGKWILCLKNDNSVIDRGDLEGYTN